MGDHLDLPFRPGLAHSDCISQVSRPVVDFDFILQEAREGRGVEDFVRGRLRGVDGVFFGHLSGLCALATAGFTLWDGRDSVSVENL